MTDPEKIEAMTLIDRLRHNEGDSVTIHNDNPEFGGANSAISVERFFGPEAGGEDRTFAGDSVLDCLRQAAKGFLP